MAVVEEKRDSRKFPVVKREEVDHKNGQADLNGRNECEKFFPSETPDLKKKIGTSEYHINRSCFCCRTKSTSQWRYFNAEIDIQTEIRNSRQANNIPVERHCPSLPKEARLFRVCVCNSCWLRVTKIWRSMQSTKKPVMPNAVVNIMKEIIGSGVHFDLEDLQNLLKSPSPEYRTKRKIETIRSQKDNRNSSTSGQNLVESFFSFCKDLKLDCNPEILNLAPKSFSTSGSPFLLIDPIPNPPNPETGQDIEEVTKQIGQAALCGSNVCQRILEERCEKTKLTVEFRFPLPRKL
eukprot:GHVP01053474.1.p1 GENE.GHVP01053474.1~~GHVP01053474.1.p1  ORF type:complete len:293 (+),score=55.49 GHVP01053474.1:3-881(+)